VPFPFVAKGKSFRSADALPKIECETELFLSVPDDAWFSSNGELQIPHFVRKHRDQIGVS
jgi:hypothetical protein